MYMQQYWFEEGFTRGMRFTWCQLQGIAFRTEENTRASIDFGSENNRVAYEAGIKEAILNECIDETDYDELTEKELEKLFESEKSDEGHRYEDWKEYLKGSKELIYVGDGCYYLQKNG